MYIRMKFATNGTTLTNHTLLNPTPLILPLPIFNTSNPAFSISTPAPLLNLTNGCLNVTCPVGEQCEQAAVNCMKAPCPNFVSCVPIDKSLNSTVTDGCAVVKCEAGEVCEESKVLCFTSPCPIQIACVKYVDESPFDLSNGTAGNWTTGGLDPMFNNTSPTCRANETWAQCANSCTEAKCVPNVSNKMCPLNCAAGCACSPSFKRNTTGFCVSAQDCGEATSNSSNSTLASTLSPSGGLKCDLNETVSQCHNKCSEKKCPGLENTMFCTKHCSVGCACKDGYLRSGDGNCYPWEDCPEENACGENEEYRCEKCDASCQIPDPDCDKKNCTKVCKCALGFVKLKGKCVTLSSCPSHKHDNITCLATEEYTDCVPKCHLSCTGAQECDSSINATVCQPGCVCRKKYKMDTNGECVHNRHCFKTTDCPDNEEWKKCQDDEGTCETVLTNTTQVPLHDTCFSGCSCSSGFVRNANGTCVTSDKC